MMSNGGRVPSHHEGGGRARQRRGPVPPPWSSCRHPPCRRRRAADVSVARSASCLRDVPVTVGQEVVRVKSTRPARRAVQIGQTWFPGEAFVWQARRGSRQVACDRGSNAVQAGASPGNLSNTETRREANVRAPDGGASRGTVRAAAAGARACSRPPGWEHP